MKNKRAWFSVPYVVWMAIIYMLVNLVTDCYTTPLTRVSGWG